jgi:hypothetical protein
MLVSLGLQQASKRRNTCATSWAEQYGAWPVSTIDGVEIILSAPDPFIFVGKAIDYQDRKFQLRDP